MNKNFETFLGKRIYINSISQRFNEKSYSPGTGYVAIINSETPKDTILIGYCESGVFIQSDNLLSPEFIPFININKMQFLD